MYINIPFLYLCRKVAFHVYIYIVILYYLQRGLCLIDGCVCNLSRQHIGKPAIFRYISIVAPNIVYLYVHTYSNMQKVIQRWHFCIAYVNIYSYFDSTSFKSLFI